MLKLLKAIHISVILLFALYACVVVVGLCLKRINPTNPMVRHWNPGLEVVVGLVALVTLLGILACSTGVVRNPSRQMFNTLMCVWVICFTWFAWRSRHSPFRLQELIGVDLTDAAAVHRAESFHLFQAGLVYAVILGFSVLPVFLPRLIRFGDEGTKGTKWTKGTKGDRRV